MRTKYSNVLWGLFFIVIGVGFAGNAFNLWDFELFFEGWWTLFIIVPCAISLFQNGFRFWSLVGLLVGIMLFLSSRGIVAADVIGKLIVPAIFVVIGLNMITKNFLLGNRNMNRINYQGNSEYAATFSSNKYQADEKFTGTNVSAVFGGFCLDLRNAVIEEDVVIQASAIFGGIDIYVPYNVKVKVNNIPIFGGVSNKALQSADANAPTIFINATCMFGGIDIK